MNIGFFSPTINDVGGGELVALNMIDVLKRKNHRIVICSAEKIDNNRIKNFIGHSIDFDEEVVIGPNMFHPYSLQDVYPNMIRSFLFHHKCDVVIDTFSNAVFPWTDVVYFNSYAKINKLPNYGLRGQIFAPYKFFLANSAKHADLHRIKLMTCSRFMAENIEKSIGLPVKVLYPPISDFFKVGNAVSSKEDLVISVFRLSSAKKPETLLEIAKLSAGNFPFIIVARCQSEDDLNTLKNVQARARKLGLGKKLKLLINVSREKQREMLQKAKVYVHPFVSHEAFGISVAEAMSAGCVPIVPDAGGLKELVSEQLRYNSIEEAAALIDKTIDCWSPSQSLNSIKSADKFSQAKFDENFINIMQL
jgi:alpha-1,2-mannosyltransferase